MVFIQGLLVLFLTGAALRTDKLPGVSCCLGQPRQPQSHHTIWGFAIDLPYDFHPYNSSGSNRGQSLGLLHSHFLGQLLSFLFPLTGGAWAVHSWRANSVFPPTVRKSGTRPAFSVLIQS